LTETARLSIERRDGKIVLAFAGKLEADAIGGLWRPAIKAAKQARGRKLALDLRNVTFCDVGGASLLAAVETAHGAPAEAIGIEDRALALLRRARAATHMDQRPTSLTHPTLKDVAFASFHLCAFSIVFIGEAAIAIGRLPRQRRMLRMPDLLGHIDNAGIRSLPLVILLGYLIGLILAFQSAVPMQQFGAEIFVASLVAIALLRELGPLLAAVILAGRTGSAFAAEIGTMKVNEEIDALNTMGIDPVTMLVLPRVIAAMLVMPVMTMTLDIAGLLGMATVLRGLGFPLVAVTRQVQQWVSVSDLYGGLFKAIVFGMIVAAIGCSAGLGTGPGPRSVGLSTTAAVVGGIVATVVADGVFALLLYRLQL
jgi:phospholipid/cholesterol/gamma-HCH transport system permease protein